MVDLIGTNLGEIKQLKGSELNSEAKKNLNEGDRVIKYDYRNAQQLWNKNMCKRDFGL